MKQTQHIKIISTTRRIVRVRTNPVCAPCSACGRVVETLALSQALCVLATSQPEIEKLIAAGIIHTIQMVNGNLRICRDSLFIAPA